MARARTADFELIIGDTPTPGLPPATQHPVQVTTPSGPGFAVIELDPADQELNNLLSAATMVAPALGLRKRAGAELFARLFQGELKDRWTESLGMLRADAFDVLRVRLWLRNPALAAVPWELLHGGKSFLAADARFTLCRYLAGPEPSYLDPVPKLRVLAVISRPTKGHLPQIPDDAVTKFKAMFDELAPQLEYSALPNPDLARVQAKLAEGYHILHYLGHGVPNELVFTNPQDGSPQPIPVENLRQVAVGRRTLRAVVLNACGSSQAGVEDVFAGVGPGLVQVGVPAVVAMQYDMVDLDTATKFNETFYPQLAGGSPVDVAVTEGRLAVSAVDVADRGWSTPVLYLGTRGGRVIEVAEGSCPAGGDPWAKLTQAAGEAADARKALDQLAGEFRTLSGQLAELDALAAVIDRLQALNSQLSPLFRFEGLEGQILPGDGQVLVPAVWRSVSQDALIQLRSAVTNFPAVAPLCGPLETAAKAVQKAIDDGAMRLIPSALTGLHATLDRFDIALRERTSRRIRELSDAIRMSVARLGLPASTTRGESWH
jgi:hypothetical protein